MSMHALYNSTSVLPCGLEFPHPLSTLAVPIHACSSLLCPSSPTLSPSSLFFSLSNSSLSSFNSTFHLFLLLSVLSW
ncbi:hypothetical protein VNO80_18422 [Phaseolus coccineus]|uniref:Uncharacterized protein n=1 Tax=Phaseolus coccineus TaxID=3886 RepID=A0AAN9ME61_PHACN